MRKKRISIYLLFKSWYVIFENYTILYYVMLYYILLHNYVGVSGTLKRTLGDMRNDRFGNTVTLILRIGIQ